MLLRSVIVVLLLSGCQTLDLTRAIGGYPSYTPDPNTPLLPETTRKDTRPAKPPAYGYDEIGLTAGEFTEFMRQRMWGCESGCDSWSILEGGHIKGRHLPINIANVPEEWKPKTREILREMKEEIGMPVTVLESGTKGRKVFFEDTTGRDYTCLNGVVDNYNSIIIAKQYSAAFTEHCLWQEIGHEYGMGSDTDNFGNTTAYRDSRSSGAFRPLDRASYWVLYDPRLPNSANYTNVDEVLATIHSIATSSLGLPVD